MTKQRRGLIASVLLMVVLGLLVRLPGINDSFWLDEAAQALQSARPLEQQLQIREDFQPPLFHLLTHLLHLVSSGEWWLRLTSFGAALASIVLLFLIGKRIGKTRVGFIASYLFALSPLHVFYSQELRPYALVTFWILLSWYLLLTTARFRFVLYSLVTLLGIFTMYLYPFFIIAQIIYVAIEQRKQLRSLLVALVVAGSIAALWIPSLLDQIEVGTRLATMLDGWSSVVAVPQLKALPLTILKFFTGQVELRDSLITRVIAVMLAAIALVCLCVAGLNRRYRLLVYWVVIPLLTVWIFSFFLPVIAPKRMLGILPPLLLAIASTIDTLLVRSKHFALTLLAFLSAASLFFLIVTWTTPAYQREPWREVISRMEASAPEGSIAVFSFPHQFAPWDWYSQGIIRPWSTASIRVTSLLALDERLSPVIQSQRVYLFTYLQDLTDPQGLVRTWLVSRGYGENGVIDGGPLGFVVIFDRMNAE